MQIVTLKAVHPIPAIRQIESTFGEQFCELVSKIYDPPLRKSSKMTFEILTLDIWTCDPDRCFQISECTIWALWTEMLYDLSAGCMIWAWRLMMTIVSPDSPDSLDQIKQDFQPRSQKVKILVVVSKVNWTKILLLVSKVNWTEVLLLVSKGN